MKVFIIGGSGLYHIEGFTQQKWVKVKTPFGPPSDSFLTGKLDGMTTRTGAGTSDYVLYSFQLIDARTSDIIWEDSAEIKKQGLEDAAYR